MTGLLAFAILVVLVFAFVGPFVAGQLVGASVLGILIFAVLKAVEAVYGKHKRNKRAKAKSVASGEARPSP